MRTRAVASGKWMGNGQEWVGEQVENKAAGKQSGRIVFQLKKVATY